MCKLSKKIVALVVSVTMMISFSLTAFTASSDDEKIITISGVEYGVTARRKGVTTVTDKSSGIVAIFNENSGMLTIRDSSNSRELGVNINDLMLNFTKGSSNNSIDNTYAYSNKTDCVNGKPYIFWQIQIPGKIKYTYEKNNVSNLMNFQLNVDKMRSTQDIVNWTIGGTAASALIGLISLFPVGMVAAIVCYLVSIGLSGASIAEMVDCSKTIKDCQGKCTTYFNSVVPVSKP